MMAAQRRGSVKVLVQPERVSLVAIATELSRPARSTLFPAGRLPVRTGSAERGLPTSPVGRAAVGSPAGWLDARGAAGSSSSWVDRARRAWSTADPLDEDLHAGPVVSGQTLQAARLALDATQSPPVARLFCEPVGVDVSPRARWTCALPPCLCSAHGPPRRRREPEWRAASMAADPRQDAPNASDGRVASVRCSR